MTTPRPAVPARPAGKLPGSPRCGAALLALALVVSPLAAQQAALVKAEMGDWYAKAKRSAPGSWGIVVADRTGTVLWSENERMPLIPASTVKVLTTGFARSEVGGNARRSTRVLGAGRLNQVDGTWQGSWAIEVNGDVTLERPVRGGTSLRDLADQLATIGIRRLVGPLTLTSAVGEARAQFPSAWESRHRGSLFAPPVGPVTLNENTLILTVAPGARNGAPAVLIGVAPAGAGTLVNMTAKTVAGNRNTALRFTSLANGRYTISGTIGVSAKPRGFSAVATNPTLVLEACWAHAVAQAGIEWIRGVPALDPLSAEPWPLRTLAEVVSHPFDSVAHEVNSRSLNIGAELLLLWGSAGRNAAERLNQHVASVTGLASSLFHVVDGSGLSGSDRVAPIVFTTYLARMPLQPGMGSFPLLLPANGSGTLRTLATGLPEAGVVRAKTGTLGNVATLVGYLGHSDGPLLIATMYNGTHPTAAKSMQLDLFRRLGASGSVLQDLADPIVTSADHTATGGDTPR